MNQRGGSCKRAGESGKSALRKIIGVLVLVGLLTFSRFAHAQGSVIFNPPGDGYTNVYSLTNGTLLWTQDTNVFIFSTNFVFTPSVISNLIAGFTFSNLLGGIISTNLTLQIISWTGYSNYIVTFPISWPPPITIDPIRLPPFPLPVATNDNFADAIELSGTAFTITENRLATAEPGEPVHGTNALQGHSTWWRWTPGFDWQTAIRHSPRGMVAVYTGASVGALQRVELATSSSRLGYPSSLTEITSVFQAQAGTTYNIAVDCLGEFTWTLDQQLLILKPVPARVNVGVPITLEATALPGNDPLSIDFMLTERFPDSRNLPPPPIGGGGTSGGGGFGSSSTSSALAVSAASWSFQFDWIQMGAPVTVIVSKNLTFPLPAGSQLLGTAYAPTYQLSWTPTNLPGPYFVWARSTNALGEVHETLKAKIDIYEANDDFEHAAEIDSSATSTNILYGSVWSSAETNELPHRFGPATHSLWWKWTPSRSGSIRFKAVRYGFGMSLEVLTGTDFSNLRRIADNQSTMSRTGLSGAVRLRVKAGQTYYIRVDEDTRGPRPTSPEAPGITPPDATFTIEPASTPLPGELNFSLIAGSFFTRNGPMVIPFGRVFQPDNRTPVTGSQYRAQLYVGTAPTDLVPVGYPMPFFSDNGFGNFSPAYAGLFYPEIVQLPNALAGQRVYAQIRVWDSNSGDSFDAAQANGGPVGVSMVIKVIAGSEETGAAPLMGMRSFSLRRPNH